MLVAIDHRCWKNETHKGWLEDLCRCARNWGGKAVTFVHGKKNISDHQLAQFNWCSEVHFLEEGDPVIIRGKIPDIYVSPSSQTPANAVPDSNDSDAPPSVEAHGSNHD